MSIIVCPLHDVAAIARARRPSHILSLLSPSAEPSGCQVLAPHHLELRFNDIIEPREGLIMPSMEHVRAILDFGKHAQAHGPLLIHCWAGVSRSPAAAYIIACDRGIAEPWPLSKRLRKAAPFCTPNLRMIALADDALEAEGALTEAILSIKRGQDTLWGAAFAI